MLRGRERERVVEREVCKNKPLLELPWCDVILWPLHGYGTVSWNSVINPPKRNEGFFFLQGYMMCVHFDDFSLTCNPFGITTTYFFSAHHCLEWHFPPDSRFFLSWYTWCNYRGGFGVVLWSTTTVGEWSLPIFTVTVLPVRRSST